MRDLFEREMNRLSEYMVSLPWEDQKFYAAFLAQSYFFTRHSTRLLALACAKADFHDDALHQRFAVHIPAQSGQERIVLNDLRKLGYREANEESPETRNLYETQYFKIERECPSSLLGYILALEGVANLIGPRILDRLISTYGREASRFIDLHAGESADSINKAFNEIEDLNELQKRLVSMNFNQSCRNYQHMLASIQDRLKFFENLSAGDYCS